MSKDTQNDEEGAPPLGEPELNQTSSKIAEGTPQEKKSDLKDDFLEVVALENGGEIENIVKSTEKLTEGAVKPKEPSPEKLVPDTPEISLKSVLKKAGVEMSSEDLGTAQEMIQTVKMIDARPDRASKTGSKLLGINRLIDNYPGLAPYADEFSQVFENAAKKPETIKFMQENYLNSVRGKFGSAKAEEPKVEVEKNSSQSESPDEKPLNQSSSKTAEEQEEQEKKQEQEEEEKKKQEQEEEQKKNQEQEAEDSVIFSPSRKSKGRSKGNVAENIDTSDVIDPITQAIRDEVLYKQQLLLQQEIAKNMEGQEKEDFLDQDLTAIRAFLQTPEGKQAVDDVMKNPQLRKEMHAIERDGYKTVHSKFSESFRDVDWGKINEDKVRTTDVKDADGNPVCTLKETTVDTKPQSITLADGTTQTINKYRQIDFPIELETGNGPMHVSMAVRDANGKPISAKEAVYFTAHYDDNGKLTEVSSPTPVHFAGDGPDAIGYIEVDGKVFTLPVTKEKYQDMMKEVAINNGLETDISQ
ncbi:MAG: Sca4 family protein, partial [Rickettsiaceae bacterium]|nr:Sca4 family protein [Rickettsiaceae bacterium]